MPYAWAQSSLAQIATAHQLLQTLCHRLIKRADLPRDLRVLFGHRSKADQDKAFASGASKLRWPKSKHNSTPSLAVDIVPLEGGAVSWDWAHYNALAPIVKDEWAKMAAEGLTGGAVLTWGGDWKSFKDGPHWELSGV